MDDLISRKAAIEACLEIARQEHDEKDPLAIAWANGVRHAARVILPTIDAAPVKHGKWTTKRTQKHDGEWYCTVCDYEPIVMSDDMKYCPGCGAKMDLGE